MAQRLGQWTLGEALGEGGQAHVYHATRPDDEKQYALKRLKNKKRLDRFKKEIDALKKLQHPGIIEIVDYDIEAAKPYFVMPFFGRGNVERAGVLQWPIERRLEFFGKILDAMSRAHGAKIVHRDVKPSNILVGDDGQPVVADFGICFFEDGKRITVTEEVMGSRYYIAPELEPPGAPEARPRCDVYSLGKTLYWMVTGEHLAREDHRTGTKDLQRRESRYELIAQLLDRMIVADPKKRFNDAEDAKEAFAAISNVFPHLKNYPDASATQRCVFCGIGTYQAPKPVRDDGSTDRGELERAFGLKNWESVKVRAMTCSVCGHVAFFQLDAISYGDLNPQWKASWGSEQAT